MGTHHLHQYRSRHCRSLVPQEGNRHPVSDLHELSQPSYVLGYHCSWTGSGWKCGCRDQACTQSYWQIQSFKREERKNWLKASKGLGHGARVLTHIVSQPPCRFRAVFATLASSSCHASHPLEGGERPTMTARLFTFVGGALGPWRLVTMDTLRGEPLAPAARLTIIPGAVASWPAGSTWLLRGMLSHERYVTRHEQEHLGATQPPLGRPEATCAALIALRKSEAWWSLAQDERRRIFEERSGHITTGLHYLPAIARRLHHCRDLGETEPFDFLTWFEYAPPASRAFDALAAELRASEEWAYVDREVDLRFIRAPA